MKKKKTGIASLMPPFAAVPLELTNDPKIKLRLKGLYAVLHSFCGEKNPRMGSIIFATKHKIAERARITRDYLLKLTKELEEVGWATIIETGREETNIVVLRAWKDQYVDEELKEIFKKQVEEMRGNSK